MNPRRGDKMSSSTDLLPHIAIFPFMSKGHTIPLIHLAHLLHRRRLATLTFFTTPLNAPFLRRSLADTEASIVELPFPMDLSDLPAGVESTDNLSSMSLFLPFIQAVKLLRPHFERALESLPPVNLLISDGFLGWTLESASKFGFPRIVFYGMGNYAMTMSAVVSSTRPHAGVLSYDEPFLVPGFPHVRLTKADLDPPFDDPDPSGPLHDFVSEQVKATLESHGLVVNSFYELEPAYSDYWNKEIGPKTWCVGPLCLAQPKAHLSERPTYLQWLDLRLVLNRPVLYVAFGTQAEVSAEQLREIAIGLERSEMDFLWVVRAKGSDLVDGFEERVADRGLVMRDWVDQMEILRHESVKGFMSHCGWNSVMESVCAAVPILAWPMLAEQRLNAKLVVEELRIGLRIRASDGTRDGLVRKDSIEEMVRELLVGEKGKDAAKKAKEVGDAAGKAMEGGSSWRTLELMVEEVCGVHERTVYQNGFDKSEVAAVVR